MVADDMPSWTKVYDSTSEAYYFYNNCTLFDKGEGIMLSSGRVLSDRVAGRH